MKYWQTLFFLFLLTFIITSCVPGEGHYNTKHLAGFFSGIWHGWIAPVTLILGLFNPEIRIYEINNTGWWYDFGFYISLIGGFGSFALFRKKKKE